MDKYNFTFQEPKLYVHYPHITVSFPILLGADKAMHMIFSSHDTAVDFLAETFDVDYSTESDIRINTWDSDKACIDLATIERLITELP